MPDNNHKLSNECAGCARSIPDRLGVSGPLVIAFGVWIIVLMATGNTAPRSVFGPHLELVMELTLISLAFGFVATKLCPFARPFTRDLAWGMWGKLATFIGLTLAAFGLTSALFDPTGIGAEVVLTPMMQTAAWMGTAAVGITALVIPAYAWAFTFLDLAQRRQQP